MTRAGQWATAAISLAFASASLLGACDIDGITPNCSDAGECATPPGTSDPGNASGGTGGAGGSNSGGSGGSTGGATGGSGGSAGTAGNGGSAGSAGPGGSAGSNVDAGGSAGSAGAGDGATGDSATGDATTDRRGDALDVANVPDLSSLFDVRADVSDGADGTLP